MSTLNTIYDLVSRNHILVNGPTTLLTRDLLDLSSRKLSDASATALAELLQTTPTLTVKELNLRGNHLSDLGATKVASALTAARSVTHLDLSANRLTTMGLKHLSQILEASSLRSLRLCDIPALGHSISPTLAAALGALPERLAALDLSNTSLLCVPALAVSLRRGGVIERLTLQNNPTALADSEAAAGALADLLKECPSLAQLNIARTGLAAEGAKKIAAALPYATGLARLDLSGNGAALGDEGIVAIAGGLEGRKCAVKVLRIAECGVGNVGGEALVKMIESNPTICAIDLAGNYISNEIIYKIEKLLSKNIKLKNDVPSKNLISFEDDNAISDSAVSGEDIPTYSCKDAFTEMCDAMCESDPDCKKALEAYFSEVSEKVTQGSSGKISREEALALALLVSGGYFAEKFGIFMTSYMTSSATDFSGAKRRVRRWVPPEAKRFIALVEAGLSKIDVIDTDGENALAFCEKVNKDMVKLGKVLELGKYVVAYRGGDGEERDVAFSVDRMEGKTVFEVKAPLAKDVTEFVVLGGEKKKKEQKVFVLSPNALFVVVDQSKAQLVEITSDRVKW